MYNYTNTQNEDTATPTPSGLLQTRVSPSTIFAVASILEGCAYINGSPQNTFVPVRKCLYVHLFNAHI